MGGRRIPRAAGNASRRVTGRRGPIAAVGDDEIAEVFQLERAADIADQVFLRVLDGEAATRIAAELRERFLELLVAATVCPFNSGML